MAKLSNNGNFGACEQIIGTDFFQDKPFHKVKVVSIIDCTIDKSLEEDFLARLLTECPNIEELAISGVKLNFHKLPSDIKVDHLGITITEDITNSDITNSTTSKDSTILDFTKFTKLNQLCINPNDAGKAEFTLPSNLKVLNVSTLQRRNDGDDFELDIPKTPKDLLVFAMAGQHIKFSDNTIKNINIINSKSLIYAICGNNELQNKFDEQIINNKKLMNYFAHHITKDNLEILFKPYIIEYFNKSFLNEVVKYYIDKEACKNNFNI
ncbi:MAG: hypothetical protein HRU35_06735 [Rickettsiaceae bacterium]|nr:hypothetical protein [Rickettsiaceae bacterium]